MMKHFHLGLLLYFLAIICRVHAFIPQIIEKIEPAIVQDKSTAYLNCTMALRPIDKDRATWYEDENKLISYGEKMNEPIRRGPNDLPKFEVRFIPGRPAYVPEMPDINANVFIYQLIVRFATEKDARRYKCTIEIKGREAADNPRAYGEVIVQRAPQITPDSKPKIVNEGEPLSMTCRAEGSPPPRISWTKANGRPFPLPGEPTRINGSELYLPNVTRYDRGVYRCYAQNNVGRADEYDVMVEVNYRPHVRQARYMGAYAQAPDKNYQVTLECIINGYPDPDLKWYKGIYGSELAVPELIDSAYYKHQKMTSYGAVGSNVTDVFFTLTILDLKQKDYGNYTCLASNAYGMDMAVNFLFHQQLCQGPVCPMLSGYNELYSASVRVQWSVPVWMLLLMLLRMSLWPL